MIRSLSVAIGKSNSEVISADTTSKSLDEIVELDESIRISVQRMLGRKRTSKEDITVRDLNSITGRLYKNGIPISSLEGLEHAISLDEILFVDAGLEDASVLSNLTQLRALGLGMNQITEIPSLQDMIKLEWFNIDNNKISDISEVTKARNLQIVEASNNQIEVLPNLEGMNELLYLELAGNKINMIEQMSGLPKLIRINLMGNQIEDIFPLADIESPYELLVQYNSITSLKGDGIFRNLRKLRAGHNDISSYDIKKNFPVLELIALNNCGINDLDGLLDHPTLEILALRDNDITDLSALAELTSDTPLTEVDLSNNKISDISALKNFDFPFVICLAGNPIDWDDEDNLKIRDRIFEKYPNEHYNYFPQVTETPTPSLSPSTAPTAIISPTASIEPDEISSLAENNQKSDGISAWIYVGIPILACFVFLAILYLFRKK